MADFVSWLEAPKEPKSLFGQSNITQENDSGILFLTDYMYWHTKEGRKVIEYDSSYNQEGAANGHGAIMKYYELTDAGFNRCRRNECNNFSSPSNFPKPIVTAIKELKMVRMSKGCETWQNLLELLHPEIARSVTHEYNIYRKSTSPENYTNFGGFTPETIENLKFKRFVSKKLQNEVKEKLLRLYNNREAGVGCMYGGSNTILQFFRWNSTIEGKTYWWNLEKKNILCPPEPIKDTKKVGKYYWHDRIWELFKDPENRNTLWR
jgi:hypothetical protein